MGEREVAFVKNGVDAQIEKWHEMILPRENVHYKVNVLFPEAVFVALSVGELYVFSKKFYDPDQNGVEHRKDVGLCDFIRDKCNLEMLAGAILKALGDVVGDDGVRPVLKELENREFRWEAMYYDYVTDYVDKCNLEYLRTSPDKRKDKLRNITKRFIKHPQTYLNIKRNYEMSAKVNKCSIYDLRDPKYDEYPEEILW